MKYENQKQFEVINVSFNDEVKLETLASVKSHYEEASSFEYLLFNWISDSRSILIVNADCDADEQPGFIVILQEAKEDLAQIVISMAWLKAQYPELKSATEYELGEEKVQEKNYCSLVADDTIDPKDSIKIIASFLFTECSNIGIHRGGEWIFEECTEEELAEIAGKQIISVNPHYQDPVTGSGFGENWWVLQELPQN